MTERDGPAFSDPFETWLADGLAVEPSPTLAEQIDGRIRAAISSPIPLRQASRLGTPRRRFVAGALLAAAVIAIAGATGGLLGLYGSFAGAGYQVAWDRAEQLGLSDIVGGYRVTIERAYADANQLMLAVSVVDEADRGRTTQLGATGATVTDESGAYSEQTAQSNPLDRTAAADVLWFEPPVIPLPAGQHHLHVEIPTISVRDDSTPPPDPNDSSWYPWHDVTGPWTFDFDLSAVGGTVVAPGVTAEAGGVSVGLSRVVIAPSTIRVDLAIDAPQGSQLSPAGEIRHGGQTFPIMSAMTASTVSVFTEDGTDNASGDWTIQIDELVGAAPDGSALRIPGPWVLSFSVP